MAYLEGRRRCDMGTCHVWYIIRHYPWDSCASWWRTSHCIGDPPLFLNPPEPSRRHIQLSNAIWDKFDKGPNLQSWVQGYQKCTKDGEVSWRHQWCSEGGKGGCGYWDAVISLAVGRTFLEKGLTTNLWSSREETGDSTPWSWSPPTLWSLAGNSC